MNRAKLFFVAAISLMVVFSSSARLFAQDDVISKRKAIMGSNSSNTKAIGGAVKDKDFTTVEAKAKEIVSNLDQVASLFPKGSTEGKTRAHPDIWAKPDEFKKRLANARKAAEDLSKAAAAKNEAEVNAKAKALGSTRAGACGECHKVFRADFRKDS